MNARIPKMNATKRRTHIIAAKYVGSFNLVFKNVNTGTNKIENKKAIKTGVMISLPMYKI
jgi:hypothetical protein